MNIIQPDRSSNAGSDVLSPVAKISTGIRGLDTILHGGLPRGHTILFSGGPGTGKTVLAMEFLCRCAGAGEPGLFVSFEEPVEDLRANSRSIGLDTGPLEAADKLKVLHFQIPHQAVLSGEFNIQGLLALIGGHCRSLGVTTIVLDAVDMLLRVFRHPEKEREQMYVLNDWLRRHSLTSIVTVKSMEEEKQAYSFLDFMADCIISLDQRTDEQVRTRRLKVVKYRGSGFLSNEHPYVISSSGTVLLPVSGVTLEYPAGDRRISTGNEVFDRITEGGFFQGASILVAGPSGSGKTTLASTFARAAGSRNEKTLYVSFEESRSVLLARVKSVGIDLEQDVDAGRLKICSLLPETAGIEEHLLWIFDMVDRFGPDHLVLDAITACRRMGSEPAEFDFLLRLITFCRKKRITCVYTNQIDTMKTVAQISGFRLSSVMDMLVSLQYVDNGTGLSRRLLVVKSRGSGHSMQYHPFTLTGLGIDIQFPADITGDMTTQEG